MGCDFGEVLADVQVSINVAGAVEVQKDGIANLSRPGFSFSNCSRSRFA
jgi:hypothetical protein